MLETLPWGELALLAAALGVAGLVGGVLAGLFGVGGGAILVPVLYQLFQFIGVPETVRMHLAVGTSLAIIIPTSIRSFRGHLEKKAVDMDVLRVWAVPVVVGVVAGTFLAAHASALVLKAIFAVVATFNALKLLLGREDWRLGASLPGRATMNVYGFCIGLLSALMGIGGGVFGNMLLTLYGKPIHRAVATSAGLGVLISIPGVIGYVIGGLRQAEALPPLSLGFVSLIGVALVAPLSVLVTPIGVRLAHGFSRRTLEIAFGVFLLTVAARFGLSLAGF